MNLLHKINHSPLIITKILEFTFERPFILFQIMNKSKGLKEKLEKFQILKINDLSKGENNLYSIFFKIINFDNLFGEIMNKKINIEQEEQNYFITKPNLNTLYEEGYQQLCNDYKKYLQNKSDLFYKNAFIGYCIYKPLITLSINLFTKEKNDTINFNLTESDLDINYIKYLNQKENYDVLKKQKFRLVINIYNRYYNYSIKNKDKFSDKFKENYFTNIELIKKLKIEEIYFIRPSFYKNNIEKVYNQLCMIEELKIMFNFLNNIEFPEDLNSVYFSDNIIKNIDLFYDEILNIIESYNKNNENKQIFKNMNYIGINLNLMNKKIKNIINKYFNYILSFIEYQDIINNNIIKNNNKDILVITEGVLFINLEKNNIYNKAIFEFLFNLFNRENSSNLNKIYKLIIVYDYNDNDNISKTLSDLENLIKINYCFLPNLKEITINNLTNKTSNIYLIDHSKIFNIFLFYATILILYHL